MQQKANARLVFQTHAGLSPVQGSLSCVIQATVWSSKAATLPKICLGGSWQGARMQAVADKLCPPAQKHQLRQVSPRIGCDAHPRMGQAAGHRGGSSHRRRVCAWAQQSYASQADSAGEAIPSLCYLLVFRRNQNKLWCLMTSSLLCAKHLKRSKVPQNITWATGL